MIDFREMGSALSGIPVENMPPYPDLPEPQLTAVHKPVDELTVGLIASLGAHAPGQPSLGRTNDLSFRTIDRSIPTSELAFDHVTPARFWADIDMNVAFPRDRMAELEAEGFIGALAPTAISFLGSISLWDRLATEMAPAIKDALDAEGVELALLVPFCPQCHQATMVLARALEARGMPTLMFSVFRDLADSYKPPRTAFVENYPLGAPCGRVNDPEHQRATIRAAFDAVPLDIESRQLVGMDMQYQEDGGRDWLETTLQHYRDRFDVVIENGVTHNTSEPLIGREEEFSITCAC